jgi:hypothetical protein
MSIQRPPLLCLGGEEAFSAYQAEFTRIYGAQPVIDVLGRVVEFLPDACRHVCSKGDPGDYYRKLPRGWEQARAERIPWIFPTLLTPYEIRPSHQTEGNQVYLLSFPADPGAENAWERFGVYVEPISHDRVVFRTAFPMSQAYWDAARLKGPRIYPVPTPKRKRRR